MIKAILLVFEPVMTWDKIALDRRSLAFVLLAFLTPVILISVGCELAGVIYYGRHQDLDQEMIKLTSSREWTYGAAQLVLSFGVVFICAQAIKAVAETFHGRHTYTQCFTVAAYALSPVFLVRVLDAFPSMSPWASFGIGIVLTVTTLYHGLPRVLLPDPVYGFGLYLTSSILLAGITALARFVTLLILTGRIKVMG